jgi:glycosyltransferase involved in cell wall biosynthesis
MRLSPSNDLSIAVIIPCYNEEITIAKVVADTRKFLPHSQIYVFDNNSKDQTVARAQAAGAHVVRSPLQGKGNVVRHAFRVVDADLYLLVDGDDTYPMDEAEKLIELVAEKGFSMAIGTRFENPKDGSFRRFHLFGNHLFSAFVSFLFHQRVTDMLSGFRVLSRDLVDQLRLHSTGFEIETDLTLQTISKGFPIFETPISYGSRPEGSHSKLSTYRDGFFILKFIFKLMKDYRPMPFFGAAAFLCFSLGIASGWQPIMDYINFQYVYTIPRAILAAAFMNLSFIFVGVGLILDSQIRSFNDQLSLFHQRLSRPRDLPTKKAS